MRVVIVLHRPLPSRERAFTWDRCGRETVAANEEALRG